MPARPARLRSALACVIVLSLAGLLAGASPASATITVDWTANGKLSHLHRGLEFLSCPSDQLCLGQAWNGDLALSRNPSSGPSWHTSGSRYVDSLNCTAGFCLATMIRRKSLEGDLYASTQPQDGLGSFARVTTRGNFDFADSISCPTSSFCAGLDSGESWSPSTVGQSAWFSRHPSQPGSWHHLPEPYKLGTHGASTEYSNLVCTTSLICLAYATNAFTEWVGAISEPTNPKSRWTYADVDPRSRVTNEDCWATACASEQFTGGACAAPAECLLTTGYGAIVSSTDIQAGASSWTRTVIYGKGIHRRGYYGLADPVCFSGSLCYILGARGDLLVSTSPFSGEPGAWQDFHMGQPPLATVRQTLSCPLAQVCFTLGRDSRGREFVLRGQVGGV